ncbi:MAG: 3-hydroxyacyl-CoA dehydrogenase family protein, partial [Parapedobacter sp.]
MPIGVVGLGLMGSSIVVSLLAAGYRVIALAPVPGERKTAAVHIGELINHMAEADLLKPSIQSCIDSLMLVEDYGALSDCKLVLECVVEDKEIKKSVYHKIAAVVSSDAVIASNTSAIPISELQQLVPNPDRFLGI